MHKILLLTFFISGFVSAACGDDPSNLLQTSNCDFDDDVSMWTASPGTSSHDNTDDFPNGTGSGAAVGTSADVAGVIQAVTLTQCVGIPNDTASKTVGVWFKGNSGFDSECNVTVNFYEGTAPLCNLTNRGSCTAGAVITSVTDWTQVSCDTGVLSGSVASATFTMACGNGLGLTGAPVVGAFTVKMDNGYILPAGGVPVELESFSVE